MLKSLTGDEELAGTARYCLVILVKNARFRDLSIRMIDFSWSRLHIKTFELH
jgi:hypothetical protein